MLEALRGPPSGPSVLEARLLATRVDSSEALAKGSPVSVQATDWAKPWLCGFQARKSGLRTLETP